MTEPRQAIADVFSGAGFETIDLAILQPADPFLDLSGEDIRRRIYVFNDPLGRELCLRPDLTIPTCLHYLAKGGAGDKARYAYEGLAFRCEDPSSGKPSEFLQSGIECIGGPSDGASDLDVLARTVEAVRAAGVRDFDLATGDLALFDQFIRSLAIPEHWQARLKRTFWQPEPFAALLKTLAGPPAKASRIVQLLSEQKDESALETVSGFLDLAGLEDIPGRSLESVTRRLQTKALDLKTEPLSPEIVAAIEAYLAIKGEAGSALAKLRTLAGDMGVDLARALESAEERLQGMAAIAGTTPRFATEFGRRFEYYTGFVFELTKDGEALAGGGRYDDLLARLGAEMNIPAVGAMIRLDRLARAVGGHVGGGA